MFVLMNTNSCLCPTTDKARTNYRHSRGPPPLPTTRSSSWNGPRPGFVGTELTSGQSSSSGKGVPRKGGSSIFQNKIVVDKLLKVSDCKQLREIFRKYPCNSRCLWRGSFELRQRRSRAPRRRRRRRAARPWRQPRGPWAVPFIFVYTCRFICSYTCLYLSIMLYTLRHVLHFSPRTLLFTALPHPRTENIVHGGGCAAPGPCLRPAGTAGSPNLRGTKGVPGTGVCTSVNVRV